MLRARERRVLSTFLELRNGIPSHDTFYRVFCALDPEDFQACFIRWVKSAFPQALSASDGKADTDIIPIDGKAIKGSRGKGKGKRAVHMVSAWSHRLGLVLGQKKVDSKSNEITAVLIFLRLLTSKAHSSRPMRSAARKVSPQRVLSKELTICWP